MTEVNLNGLECGGNSIDIPAKQDEVKCSKLVGVGMGFEGDDQSSKRLRRRKSRERRRGDARSAQSRADQSRIDQSRAESRPRRPELPPIRRPGLTPLEGNAAPRKPRSWLANLLARRRPKAAPRPNLSLTAPRPASLGGRPEPRRAQGQRSDGQRSDGRRDRRSDRPLRAVESRRSDSRSTARGDRPAPAAMNRSMGPASRRPRVAPVYRVPQQSAPRRLRRSRPAPYQPSTPLASVIFYALRLIIVGVGIGVIAGTLLAALDPSNKVNSSDRPATQTAKAADSLGLAQEILPLKARIMALAKAAPGITPGVMILDLDSRNYVSINADRKVSSASLIKLPILVAFFQAVDSGQISLKDPLTLKPELLAKEAGEMQFKPIGTKFTALETATEMIRISDNTATNLLIDRLGGAAALNSKFQSWGLVQTQITALLPDLQGTNTTTPKELVTLLQRVTQGELVSMGSRDRIFEILRSTETNDLLPQGIGSGATIAHKTGTLSALIGDVGLVDSPNGKRYLIMALAERPAGDERAEDLIRQISKETYQFMDSSTKIQGISAPKPIPRSSIAEDKKKPASMTTERQPDP